MIRSDLIIYPVWSIIPFIVRNIRNSDKLEHPVKPISFKKYLQVPASLLSDRLDLTYREILVLSVFIDHYNLLCDNHPEELARMNMESEIYGEDVEVPHYPNDKKHPYDKSKIDPREIQFFFSAGYVHKRLPRIATSHIYLVIDRLEEKGFLLREGKIDGSQGTGWERTLYRILWIPGQEPVKQKEQKQERVAVKEKQVMGWQPSELASDGLEEELKEQREINKLIHISTGKRIDRMKLRAKAKLKVVGGEHEPDR